VFIVEERPERALTIREFCEAEHMLLELDHLSARLGAPPNSGVDSRSASNG
jgi:hypothetical protein